MLPISVLAVFSAFIGRFALFLVIIISFSMTRKYTGGFHAKTPFRCFVMTVLLVGAAILNYDYLKTLEILTVFCAFGIIVIMLLAPIESDNNPLNELELVLCKGKSIIILTVLFIAICVCKILGNELISTGIIVGILLTAFSVLLGKVPKIKVLCRFVHKLLKK